VAIPKLPVCLATAATAAVALGLAAPPVRAADPLPALTIDLAQTSVSGLSSGAYMAGQFHLAFSGSVAGAAIVAGGPYLCAEGQLALALTRCMQTSQGQPNPTLLLVGAERLAAAGAIDPLANLADDQVYVFAGTADRTVLPAVVARVPEFYALAGVPPANIRHDDGVPAGHGFVTEDGPVPCSRTGAPYVNDCDLDQARLILEHLHGPLNPPAAQAGATLAFDQTAYLTRAAASGMAATGRAYVPASCTRQGAACRVHVAFHGCKQTEALVGDAYTAGTGFNRWAETNGIVVLYPQAQDGPGNPNGCWDWWGYTDQRYATKDGVQVAAVHRMLLALAGQAGGVGDGDGGAFCARHDAWNAAHLSTGRAVACGLGRACAFGSGDPLGALFAASTVYEHPRGFYTSAPCGR
jgi:poly(3-hydroxybutyrate) depolymerase